MSAPEAPCPRCGWSGSPAVAECTGWQPGDPVPPCRECGQPHGPGIECATFAAWAENARNAGGPPTYEQMVKAAEDMLAMPMSGEAPEEDER